MKSKTKTVGGNPVKGLGQDFNNFLQSGLTGNFGANSMAQTQGMGGAINNLLQGQIGDPTTLQGFLQGLQGNGGVGNLPNVSGNFNAPQFQGMDFGQLGQVGTQGPNIQMGQQNAGLNFGGLNLPQFSGANLNTNVGGVNNLGQIQFNPFQFQGANLQGGAGAADINIPNFQNIGFQQSALQNPNNLNNFLNPSAAAGMDPNGSFSQALQQIAQQQLNSGVADVRERFTGQSGTPAGFAEAALRAQLQPQLISQLSQANQAERGLNLQQMGMNQQNTQGILGLSNDSINQMNNLRLQQSLAGNQQGLQGAQLGMMNQQLLNDAIAQMNQQQVALSGQAANVGMNNAQLGLNAQGINTTNQLQNQGLNNDALLGLNNQFLQQSQNQNQFGMQGVGMQQQQQQMLNNALLQQMGMGNDALNQFNNANLQNFGMQQQGQGMNQNAQLQQMAQMLGQNQFMNQFNQGNAQFGANLGQQAQGMNAQNMLNNQGQMNQFGLGQANVGMQNQQQQLQAILGALGPMFGGMQQAAGLATPQAQVVQQPSMFSQITGGLGNLLGGAGGFMSGMGGLGSLFGGGVPNLQMPSNFGQQITPNNQMPWQMPQINPALFPSVLGRR